MNRNQRVLTWVAAACLLAAPSFLFAQQPPPAEGDEAALIAVLKSDAELFDKAKACQQLAVTGTEKCVPVLAGLLADEKLSHYARFGLEPNPAPAAGAALRDSLDKVQGGLLVGVINSIGMRRDAEAIPQLKARLGSSEAEVAAAAAAALARICTPESIAILKEALGGAESRPPAVAAACLTAADMLLLAGKQGEAQSLFDAVREASVPKHVQMAALAGAIRARGNEGLPMLVECLRSGDEDLFEVGLQMAHDLPGSEVTRALVEELPRLAPPAGSDPSAYLRQSLVIYTLGDRGDHSALPVVLQLAKSKAEPVRLPAVRVLAVLGNASAIPVLLEAAVAGSDDLAEAARNGLADLKGEDVHAALVAMLGKAEGQKLLELIAAVGKRGVTAAAPQLSKMAESKDEQVRKAAVSALGSTVGLDGFGGLVDRLIQAESADMAAVTKEALRKAAMRSPDREASAALLLEKMDNAPVQAKVDLLELLGIISSKTALEGVAAAAKDPSEEVQDAATRVLGDWMSPDAAPLLLELAKAGSEKYKVRTLRGYLRIARQLDVPAEERIAMCRKALEVAERDAEKKLAFEILGRYPSASSLDLLVPYLEAGDLKQPAAEAAVAVSEKIIDDEPAAVAAAMKKVVDVVANNELKKKSRALLRRAER